MAWCLITHWDNFTFYLSVTQDYMALNYWTRVNLKEPRFERSWLNLSDYSDIYMEGLKKIARNLGHGSPSSDQDLNSRPPEKTQKSLTLGSDIRNLKLLRILHRWPHYVKPWYWVGLPYTDILLLISRKLSVVKHTLTTLQWLLLWIKSKFYKSRQL
jgi:hypothetical protein